MNTFQLPAVLHNYRSLVDKTMRITFETGELSPEKAANVHYALQQHGYLVFAPDALSTQELEVVDKIRVDFDDAGKSPAYRMRAVLYRCYESNNEGFDTFEVYYRAKMEKFINHLKSTLV